MNYFNLEPEKYYDIGAKYTKQEKKEIILAQINSNNYIASIKKDGHYNKFIKQNNQFSMQSRTKSTITGDFNDKKDHVPHIFNTLKRLPGNNILIGELYIPGKTSIETGSILQCKVQKALSRQNSVENKLHYYLFDIWVYNGVELFDVPYEARITLLQQIFKKQLSINPFIEIANFTEGAENILSLLEKVQQENEEGIVLVKKGSYPEPGHRTAWKTIKVKKELNDEIDCFTTGKFLPPNRDFTGDNIITWKYWENLKTHEKLEGLYFDDYDNGATIEPVTKTYFHNWPGSIEIAWYHNGKIEIVGYISNITDKLKEEFKNDPNNFYLKPCKINAMQWTEDKKLRHGVFRGFREDIDPKDCTYEKVFKEEI